MNMNPAVSSCIKLHIIAIPTSVRSQTSAFFKILVSESTSSETFFSLKIPGYQTIPQDFTYVNRQLKKQKHATSPRVLPSDEAGLAAFLAVVFDHLIRAFQGFIDLRLQGEKNLEEDKSGIPYKW